MKRSKPILHARDHMSCGPDPIPGLLPTGSYSERVRAHSSLIAYWPMADGGSGALDISGHEYHLSQLGSPFYTGASVALNGNDHTGVPVDDAFTGSYAALGQAGGDITVQFRIRPAVVEYTLFGGITFCSADVGGAGHFTQLRADYTIMWSVGHVEQAQSDMAVNVDDWTQVTCTRDDSSLHIYFDGMQVGAAPSEEIESGELGLFYIGVGLTTDNWSYYYQGEIADVALFSEALTPGEIANILAGNDDTKGALLTTNDAGSQVWLPPGADGQALTADSTISTGLRWADAATGGDPASDTLVWMPLADSDGTLVLDAGGSVIPTLIPIG